jgi:hypothetical protein
MAPALAVSLYKNTALVIPAQAGIQKKHPYSALLDPGMRRDDGGFAKVSGIPSGDGIFACPNVNC